jgi:hypothetical protein
VLLPSESFVLLYSPECKPKEGFDVGIEAVFPPDGVSLPNGKKLDEFLHRRKSASVRLSGTFDSEVGSYGPYAARFRFTISEIASVAKAPQDASP